MTEQDRKSEGRKNTEKARQKIRIKTEQARWKGNLENAGQKVDVILKKQDRRVTLKMQDRKSEG